MVEKIMTLAFKLKQYFFTALRVYDSREKFPLLELSPETIGVYVLPAVYMQHRSSVPGMQADERDPRRRTGLEGRVQKEFGGLRRKNT